MNVDTAEFAAISDQAAQAAAARAETATVLRHIGTFYDAAYQEGYDAALGELLPARPRPPLRLVR